MPRALRRCWVLSGIALCAVLAGPVAIAQASDNTMRATINSYAPKIVKDENAVKNGLTGYPHGKVKPLLRALNHEVSDLRALKRKLADESPSSARGAEPVTGASSIPTPRSASRAAIACVAVGPIVEQSMQSVPGAAVLATPSSPSRTSST